MGIGKPGHSLAHNENPFAPPAEVRTGLHEMIAEVNRYPEFHPEGLITLIADWRGVSGDTVAVGLGAGGVAHDLFRAVLGPGENVVFSAPGFDLYPMLCAMTGADAVAVPLGPDGRQNLTALAERIDARTRLVIVCNPHNPTGTLLNWTELSAFFDKVPPEVGILLDEAYIDFASDDRVPDVPSRLAAWPNLVVLRTFSKSHGLAALRVGYALASAAHVHRIRSHQLPFAMNQFQLAGVTAALAAEGEVRERIAHIVSERERVRSELIRRGWSVAESHANFLWISDADQLERAHKALVGAGVAVRYYPDLGIRLAVGEKAANDAVLAALTHV